MSLSDILWLVVNDLCLFFCFPFKILLLLQHFKCLKGFPPSLITQFNWNYGAYQKVLLQGDLEIIIFFHLYQTFVDR